jgi:hypothetical protein
MKNYLSNALLVILITCLCTVNLSARGLYATINTGYGTGINTSNISNFTETARSYTYERLGLSFGKGINLGGSIGYLYTRNLGVELGISYLSGLNTTGTGTYLDRIETNTFNANMFRIIPTFVFSAGYEKINPYLKLGLIIGVGSFTHTYNVTYPSGYVLLTDYKWNGGMAVGFTSALGATCKLNTNLSLFGELNLISLNYSPQKMVITAASDNGTSVLESMSTHDKETVFVNSYTVDRNNTVDPTKPNTTIRVSFPFSSLGINVGIRINLAKYIDEVKKSAN